MKIFIDTNVFIDILAKREPYYLDTFKLVSYCDKNSITLTTSTNTITDIYYILQKQLSSKRKAKNIIKKFIHLVELLPVVPDDITNALNVIGISDFEDAIQYVVAKRNHISYIITRNKKDFKQTTIPVLTPNDFINR